LARRLCVEPTVCRMSRTLLRARSTHPSEPWYYYVFAAHTDRTGLYQWFSKSTPNFTTRTLGPGARQQGAQLVTAVPGTLGASNSRPKRTTQPLTALWTHGESGCAGRHRTTPK